MNSPLLGNLERDSEINEWLLSPPVPVPYFNGLRLPFVLQEIEEDSCPADFEAAVGRFIRLGSAEREHAGNYVFRLYRRYTHMITDDGADVSIPSASAVWDYVTPTEIHVSRRRRDRLVYVEIHAECRWDIEHGLVVIYRDGSILSRVSEFDGHVTTSDAFGLAEEKDTIVYEG